MRRNPNLREKYLDGEKLFQKYFEMGEARSIGRLARWAISEGMARPTKITRSNPEGLPHMGVWKAMWRWASLKENQETAWKIYHSFNPDVSWAKYQSEMLISIKTAWQHATNAKYQNFLKENGWT